MSTLQVSTAQITTLSDGTNSTSCTNAIQGSAKAWVRFTGSTGATLASYNVSSVTRTGTGSYTVNITNALADANYSAVVTADRTGQSGIWANPTGYTSSALTFICATAFSGSSTYNAGDPTVLHVAIFR